MVWLLCRLQEIRLDLTDQPAKEATLSCPIMTRWKRGWLLYGQIDAFKDCGKTKPGGGLKVTPEEHNCIHRTYC